MLDVDYDFETFARDCVYVKGSQIRVIRPSQTNSPQINSTSRFSTNKRQSTSQARNHSCHAESFQETAKVIVP